MPDFAIYPIWQYPLRALGLYQPEPMTHYSAKASLHAQYSSIPSFHHSNWGEAPNLCRGVK